MFTEVSKCLALTPGVYNLIIQHSNKLICKLFKVQKLNLICIQKIHQKNIKGQILFFWRSACTTCKLLLLSTWQEEQAGPAALPFASCCGGARGWLGWAGSPQSCLQPGLLAVACTEYQGHLWDICCFVFPLFCFYIANTNYLTIPAWENTCDCSNKIALYKEYTLSDHTAGQVLLHYATGWYYHATQLLLAYVA